MNAFGEGRLIDQAIPDAKCWQWKPLEEMEEEAADKCEREWGYFTGFIAGFFFIALAATSFNWFRRRFYRAFYICHVIFGPMMIIMGVMHWSPLVYYIAPSVIYYLASTMPVLVQALASRLRGGVKITQVVAVQDSGGCVEITIATAASTQAHLAKEVCMFVRVCVPSISLVWHPFTAYTNPKNSTTASFLVRPVGPFTKVLVSRLLEEPKPIVMVDGLYRGGDRINEALCHDVVSIVCGGVAISPFLSMIPGLLNAMKYQSSIETRRLVVHWVCREEGLISFVCQKYLTQFKQTACDLGHSDFETEIIVYHTGSNKGTEAMTPSDLVEVTDVDVVIDSTNRDQSDTPSEGSKIDTSKTVTIVSGQNMELARFMPAVNSHVLSNIPHFLLMGGSLWIGFMIMHHFLYNYDFKVLADLTHVWSTIVWVFASLALAILSEMFFSNFQKCIPEIKPETYAVKSHNSEAGITIVDMEHRVGRPQSSDIFARLENSKCPGIFMCGPHGLTSLVRQEAAMENSHFGLTRFALYEEPFEM